ncbi:MAG: alanine racemase [Acidimicrobiia bacterium]|nr:alanine racemase [Acidimicrobiia bacterium]
MRPSWVEVDLDAITHNAAAIAAEVAPATLCAVVKADGYGHGDVPVAEAAIRGGATSLAVALVEEGVRLRDADIDAPILILSEPPLEDAQTIVSRRLIPTVYRQEFAAALSAAAEAPVPVHIKVNTGMHRVGAEPADVPKLVEFVAADPNLELEGLWTHFAVAEEDEAFTKGQLDAFQAVVDGLAALGVVVPMLHAANTAGALDYPGARFDMVRVGLGLYGLRPAPTTAPAVALRPAMRVVSAVSMVKRLAAGERPSYGRRRALPADSVIATVPVGYADGVSRRLTDEGHVLIGGKSRPFAGSVTMDQLVVDMGDDVAAVGDEAVVLGTQGDAAITAEDWADLLGTINYEVVCHFGPRLPRRYIRAGR